MTERASAASPINANIIGQRLREIRKSEGWRLADVAERTGISVGTLSKLENGKTELNFTSVNKLAAGLGLRVTDFTHPKEAVTGQRTFTRSQSGIRFHTSDLDYEILCSDHSNAQQGYMRGSVKARTIDPNMPWHRHEGQEFLYVVSGRLILHTELYEPVELKAGDSILFDSSMGHHYVSKGRKDAEILIAMSLEGYENISDTFRPRSKS